MTKHIREIAPFGIENVSRRGVLKGMVSTGGLVLAVSVLPRVRRWPPTRPNGAPTACRTAR